MQTQITNVSDTRIAIIEIAHQMIQAGLPKTFIAVAAETAFKFEGVYNLMQMWRDESEQEEQDEIVADLQDLIDDCKQPAKVEGAHIRFDDLDSIAKNIRKFKDHLRIIVDKNGGITKLAALTEIPQPSLSRFFNSASMPRRAMLNKIARALNLSQVQMDMEWLR